MANPTDPVSVPPVNPAPATAPALDAVAPVAAKAGWLTGKTKVGIVVGGSLLSLVGGVYGVKSLGSGTPKAVAQAPDTKPAAVAPLTTPTEPRRLPEEINELPGVTVPKPPVVDNRIPRLDLGVDDIATPPPLPNPGFRGDLVIDPPPLKPIAEKRPLKNDFDIEPPPLPAVTRTGTVNTGDKQPILRVGGQTSTETAPPPPKAPVIDIDLPPLVAPPKVGNAPPAKLEFDLVPPPVVAPAPVAPAPKVGDVAPPPTPGIKEDLPMVSAPTLGPTPKPPVVEPAPTIDLIPTPPVVTPKPPVNLDPLPPAVTPKPPVNLDPLPPAVTPKPPAEAPKRDEFDEDWHTPKAGDTYAMISKEYYKTADMAQALEAYNKDRRKGGENIVRVPPLWVLEEKFPALTTKSETRPAPTPPGTPAPKSSPLNFEPVEGRPIGSSAPAARPAPAPAITAASGVNDEYRVQAEAGETIREIARKLYGDGNAWKRIYDMNPSVDPTQPIPVGTTLRLPR